LPASALLLKADIGSAAPRGRLGPEAEVNRYGAVIVGWGWPAMIPR